MRTRKSLTPVQVAHAGQRVIRQVIKKLTLIPALSRSLPRSKKGLSLNIDLSLVGARSMSKLNHQYRGKNYPTDVLSFPAPDLFQKKGFLGELVICTSVLKQQAKTQNHSIQTELKILIVHGVIHLLGFDHEKGLRQARQMARLESALLQAISGKSQAALGLICRSGN